MEVTEAVLHASDPTPGLVLIYSKSHADLPTIVPADRPAVSIGRIPGNTYVIAEAAISRHHATLLKANEGCRIRDNGSTNGIFVNGVRTQEAPLRNGDVVRVGDSVFRFAESEIFKYAHFRVDERRETEIIGGYQIRKIADIATRVAGAGLSVVILGESGTGKELFAQHLHRVSGRPGRFGAINCAAIPANLLESELFGVVKGAFTGANTDKPGHIRAAHGGTLFLDEIGDMPLEAQAKLLRVLQERAVVPVGGTQAIPVDIRIVAATHRDLESMVERGEFRGDLLARLRECTLRVPPLRERREDLYQLVQFFSERISGFRVVPSLAAMLAMAHYDWPYNVRELESAIKVGLAMSGGATLDLSHLPQPVQEALHRPSASVQPAVTFHDPTAPSSVPVRKGRSHAPPEAELRELLTRHRGNLAAIGRELGKNRVQIHRWLQHYGLDPEPYRR